MSIPTAFGFDALERLLMDQTLAEVLRRIATDDRDTVRPPKGDAK